MAAIALPSQKPCPKGWRMLRTRLRSVQMNVSRIASSYEASAPGVHGVRPR